MNYPSINEYIEAIRFAEDNFEKLKNLRPVLGEDGEPVMTSGNFAVVFKMKDEQTGKLHAVKCFLREQEGRAEAYRMIAEELEYVSSTFLTPIKYLDKELFVDTNAGDDKEFPVLLMDWVEGDTLDKYIRKHLDDQYELSLLAYQFSRLAMWLMPQPFAHGDLKPDNILVKSDGTLVLVDYDGMYVPAMKGQKARELGSPDFRHPSRTETDFDEHIDDFSLASILLSLKAISLQPSLLEEYGAQDRLLFSANDYRNISGSEALDAVKTLMQDAELASLYSLFILAASQNNLFLVSFRLFNLNRPKEPEMTEDDYEAWIREIEADYEQSQYEKQYQDWIEECLNESNKEKIWPLLTFARQHGKMQVGEFVNKETGETFKSCIFTDSQKQTRCFVAFSPNLGVLSPKEILARKNDLYVVQRQSGGYSLCSHQEALDNFGPKAGCSNGEMNHDVGRPTGEDIEKLIEQIEEIKAGILTAVLSNPRDIDNERIKHLQEIKCYLYFGWEAYGYGNLQIVPKSEQKTYCMFRAKAFDNNGRRIPGKDFLVEKIPETIQFVLTDYALEYSLVRDRVFSFLKKIQSDLNNGIIVN